MAVKFTMHDDSYEMSILEMAIEALYEENPKSKNWYIEQMLMKFGFELEEIYKDDAKENNGIGWEVGVEPKE